MCKDGLYGICCFLFHKYALNLLSGFKIGDHKEDSMHSPPLGVRWNLGDLDQQRTQFPTSFREGLNMARRELKDSQDH